MAATSYQFVAGAYQVEFGTVDLGRTEAGFEIVYRPAYNMIRVDEAGRTPVDALMVGMEDIIIRMETIEWTLTAWQEVASWLFTGTVPTDGLLNPAGNLVDSSLASLVLTPVTGNAVTNGGTWTFTSCLLQEPVRMPFSAQRLRTMSLGFLVYGVVDYGVSSVVNFYSVTGLPV